MTALRSLPPRLLAIGGAGVFAVIIGLALLMQNTAAACAAPPTGSTVHGGKATYYNLGGGMGNCSFPSTPADDLYVALGNAEYDAAGGCGSYLEVTGPKGATVRVKVVDRCPECLPGHIDLSLTAFKKIGDQVKGVLKVDYRTLVNPGVPGPLSVRVGSGSSRWWLSLLIDNHGNRLESVQVQSPGGGWRDAERKNHNYWVISSDVGPGPFNLKITDVYGGTRTATGITLSPEKTQTSGARSIAAAPTAKPTPKKSSAAPSPSPSAVSSSSAAPTPASTGLVAAAGAPGGPIADPAVALAAAEAACG